ncbi:MAG: coproporphyrinogen III oxidase [Bacteroidetes bacterium]|nr:MAG: coproporphyrinogen III oxidase [Bacteroidota bacterium]
MRREFFKHYYLYIKSKILAGIYIHIPYCNQACHYCNFHFSTSLRSMGDMVVAISKELSLRENYLEEGIDTIYFGGGTPSLLSTEQLHYLLSEISSTFKLNQNAEITLEANPEDITTTKAKDLIDLGFNRISLGVQSFDDEILKKLNRAHSKVDAVKAIQILQTAGFTNLTIDLIYGIPEQNLKMWESNLALATKLNVQHLSCYALTIEEKTAFGHWQKSGKLKPVPDTKYDEEYQVMAKYLAGAGYEHYEVSNFAKTGYESQHNSSYWQQEPYLGLGPGAHSYNGSSRQYNVSNNATYIKALTNDKLPFEIEKLSQSQIYNEYILTGLRTKKGIDLLRIKQNFEIDILEVHKPFLDRCMRDHLLIIDYNHIILTDKALILADSIIVELMIDE